MKLSSQESIWILEKIKDMKFALNEVHEAAIRNVR
jgi:hypothetical protein